MFDLSPDADNIGFHTYLEAGEFIIKNLNLGDNGSDVAISTFHDRFDNLVPLRSNKSKHELIMAINSLRMKSFHQQTEASTLVTHINNIIVDTKKRQIIVIFTQGGSIVNIGERFHEFRYATGTRVASVGHGENVHVDNHVALTFDPALRFFIGQELYTDVHVLSVLVALAEYETCPD